MSLKPYFDDGKGIVIYNGDCREIMPQLLQFELVVMDPPYGMNFRSNHRAVKHDKIAGDLALPVDLIEMAIAKATMAAYAFCRWDNLSMMPAPKSVLCWVKNNHSMGDLEHEHGRQWEAICFYAKEQHKFVNRIPDVVFADRTGNDLHPTEKPVSLIGKLIAANFGETILDPFMGSGTTLVAAREHKRKVVGIELSERYCETAAKRFEQALLL